MNLSASALGQIVSWVFIAVMLVLGVTAAFASAGYDVPVAPWSPLGSQTVEINTDIPATVPAPQSVESSNI